jgi:SanA protein|tara:strand:+ start:23612 stop:24259 length:648 start_codon:yes stop_codon:yes gene_type:complete
MGIQRSVRIVKWVLGLGFTLFCGIFLGPNLTVLGLSLSHLETEVEAVPNAPIAVILGAGPGSPTLDARLDAGLELFRAGVVSRLLVSGGSDGTGYGETEYMWRYLRRRGVGADAIIVDPLGMRTLDSVLRAKRVFGFETIIVVTQRYHAHRAVFLARWSGLNAWGFVAADVDSPEFRYSKRREWLARPRALADIVTGREARYGDEFPLLTNHPAK